MVKPADPCAVALAVAFSARRCRCGAPATVVCPGRDRIRVSGVLIARAVADRNRCLAHVRGLR